MYNDCTEENILFRVRTDNYSRMRKTDMRKSDTFSEISRFCSKI